MSITAATVVYAVGFNMSGYSPDPSSVSIVATLDAARIILADLIDQFIDHESEGIYATDTEADLEVRTLEYDGWLWSDHGYAQAAKEGLEAGGGEWIGSNGTCISLSADSGYMQSYWIDVTTVAVAFGEEWESDESDEMQSLRDELEV